MFRRFAEQSQPAPALAPVKAAGPPPAAARAAAAQADDSAERRFIDLKVRLHQRVLEKLNLSMLDQIPQEELRAGVGGVMRDLLVEDGVAVNAREYQRLVDEILDEVMGLGPLEPLLKDPTVSDILANTHAQVFVERAGQLELTPVRFKDDRHLLRIIGKIVNAVGRRVDESQPWVDARLADGSRVNAMIPPCAVDGPLLSIGKFSRTPLTFERLVEIGSISQAMTELLSRVVRCRLNVLISGGTGSGKTTTLNALSSFISDSERIVTIEDAAELQLQQTHVARMETRPPNIEGRGEVTQRDLLRNALRMRPDRIIVGEVRGAEALDMLQAMNTGHEGSMTTIHANTPRDALSRLEQMIGMTGIDFPMRSMRAQIASAIHVVVQIQRMSDGRRRLVSLQEITGMEGEVVSMQEIFAFRRTGTDAEGRIQGHFAATGVRPKFARRLEEWGMPLPEHLFDPRPA
jgi:pilus assembly protein CpaF